MNKGWNNLTLREILCPRKTFKNCLIKSPNIPENLLQTKGSTNKRPASSFIKMPFNT